MHDPSLPGSLQLHKCSAQTPVFRCAAKWRGAHRRTAARIRADCSDTMCPLLAVARWFRSHVSVKCRSLDLSAAWPPSDAAAFMRVRFRRDHALSGRSAAAAETGATQIETAPKKVDRTRLADEARAKLLQNDVRRP